MTNGAPRPADARQANAGGGGRLALLRARQARRHRYQSARRDGPRPLDARRRGRPAEVRLQPRQRPARVTGRLPSPRGSATAGPATGAGSTHEQGPGDRRRRSGRQARASVVVVRRDVHLAVRDVKRGGTRGVIRASLTPRGLRGRVALGFPNGQRLVARRRLTSIQVTSYGSVSLLGRAKVDGRRGYRFVVFPESELPAGHRVLGVAWRVGKPRQVRRQPDRLSQRVPRPAARPPVN